MRGPMIRAADTHGPPLPTDKPGPLIKLDGVGHSFGGRHVFGDLTLELGAGRVGLVGVNGAGKSTLMRILTTELEPTQGSLSFPGLGGGRIADHIGYMPQEMSLPGALRVCDFLTYVAWLKAVPRRERGAEVAQVLDVVGLSDRDRTRFSALSGGMKRRLLLAQALIGGPRILILDEPTAGLDPEQRVRFRELVTGMEADLVLVSSHALEDLVPVTDRVLMLDEHELAFDGSMQDLGDFGAQSSIAGMSTYEAAFVRLRARHRAAGR